jgi:hypothetical protein
MKQSESPQNKSFWHNEVDPVPSLQKIPTQFRLANLCVNGTSSATFASTFVAVSKQSETPENKIFRSNGVDRVPSFQKIPTQLHLANWF